MKKIFLLGIFFGLLIQSNLASAQCAKIDSLLRVLSVVQDVQLRTNSINLLAKLYLNEPDGRGRAMVYAQQAYQAASASRYEKGMADALVNFAHVHNHEKRDYDRAFEEFEKALVIYEKLNLPEELATTHEEVGKMYYDRFYVKQVNYQIALNHYLKAIKIREKQDDKVKLVDDYDLVGELYSHIGNDKLALQYFGKAVEMREKYKMGISNDSRLLAKAKRVYDLEAQSQRLYTYVLALVLAVALLLGLVLVITLFINRRRNQLLREQKGEIEVQNLRLVEQKELIEEQKEIIEIEQRLSNSFNFMPPAVFEEIKEKGIAQAHQYDKVSILFSDLEHFTNISKNFTTQELIEELNSCFNKFDEIIENHHLIKLKTLGDSYMCAGGLPKANDTNPIDMVLASLEMVRYIQSKRAEKEAKGEPYWRLRVGINTGYVLAGVIGKTKLAYDVWGESVSLAKKMEDRSSSDKVTISEYTYQYVKDFFDFEPRVEMKVKPENYIEEYVVAGIKTELSENGEGLIPNRDFKEKMLVLTES